MGSAILTEFLTAVDFEYSVDTDKSSRLYGEFLNGYNRLPVKFKPTSLKD